MLWRNQLAQSSDGGLFASTAHFSRSGHCIAQSRFVLYAAPRITLPVDMPSATTTFGSNVHGLWKVMPHVRVACIDVAHPRQHAMPADGFTSAERRDYAAVGCWVALEIACIAVVCKSMSMLFVCCASRKTRLWYEKIRGHASHCDAKRLEEERSTPSS